VSPSEAHGVSNEGPAMTERRAVPRARLVPPLEAKVMSIQSARILDISSHGAQIEVAGMLQPSGRCDLRIQFADGEFAAHATVRRCRASGFSLDANNESVVLYRAGLEFDELDPECLAWLSSNVLFQAEA
jgi:PilZ domain